MEIVYLYLPSFKVISALHAVWPNWIIVIVNIILLYAMDSYSNYKEIVFVEILPVKRYYKLKSPFSHLKHSFQVLFFGNANKCISNCEMPVERHCIS